MIGHQQAQVGPSRPRLRPERLRRALVTPGGRWTELRVVDETGSTNADVMADARSGAAEGLVLIAEHQHAGRGRLDRSWQAPARAGLTFSVLLRPSVEPAQLGWLPLLAGLAVAEACLRHAGVESAVKWPNDLLVRSVVPGGDWGKCGGILAEAAATDAVVVGIGVNVSQGVHELPPVADPQAYQPTSLAVAGSSVDRERIAVAVLRELDHWYGRWLATGGDAEESGLRSAYRDSCHTVGRQVTAILPGGARLDGTAVDVDADGRLLLATPQGTHRLTAGDVYHVR